MKIGIDLDDVVFDLANFLIESYKKNFGEEIFFDNLFSYQFEKVWHLNKEETINFFNEILNKESTENLNLCEFAKEIIFELSKRNQIYFITSRVHREGTIESLNKHFSNISFELIFSSNPYIETKGKTKGEICEELGINYMIEDCPKHSLICAEKRIKVFLLDKPWNQNCIKHENILRVKNWNEILDKLK